MWFIIPLVVVNINKYIIPILPYMSKNQDPSNNSDCSQWGQSSGFSDGEAAYHSGSDTPFFYLFIKVLI